MNPILRITDGTDTVDFYSDDYSLNDQGWVPNVADQGDVPESLSINIMNGVKGGGTANGSRRRFAWNKEKLKRLLRNAQRFGLGDSTVAPVRWEWAPQNADPARLWASLIVGWDETEFLPATLNDPEGQVTEQLNGVMLNIVRRSPWLQTAYLAPNLLAGTTMMLGWTGTPNGAPTESFEGIYGGQIFRHVPMVSGGETFYSATFAITGGVTYKVILTYGSSGDPPNVAIAFKNSARTTNRSNVVNSFISIYTNVADGQQLTVLLTATSDDATARLVLTFGAAASTEFIDVAEVLITTDVDAQTWYPQYSEISESNTSLAAQAPSIHQLTFTGDVDTPSPVTLMLGGFTPYDTPIINNGYIIVTDQLPNDGLMLIDWLFVGTGFTNVNDNAALGPLAAYDRLPFGGQVNRYTPSSTNPASPGVIAQILPDWKGRIQIYAAVRNNSATTTFYLQAVLSKNNLSAPARRVEIPPQAIPTPQIIALGEVSSVDGLDSIQLYYEASAASGTFDVDYVAAVRMDEQTCVIPHGRINIAPYFDYDEYVLKINPRSLDAVTPRLYVTLPPIYDELQTIQATYHRGDLQLAMRGTTLSAIWLATFVDGANQPYWRHKSEDTGSIVSITMQATRLPATDVPL